MIKFACSNCGRHINVDDKHSGKKGKCPQCGNVVVVPGRPAVIEFHCESCGQKIKVSQAHAGKKGKCPKCNSVVVVPSLKKAPAEKAKITTVTCSMCGQVVEVPEGSSEEFAECPTCGSYIETSSESIPGAPAESGAPIPPTTDEDIYEGPAEAPEESVGVDRRVIVLISAAAAVVVIGLVILVVVLRPSRQQQQVVDTRESPMELELDQVQHFAERYIGLLASGAIDEALQLHSPGFGQRKSVIAGYSGQIGMGRIIKIDCRRTQYEPHPEGDQILLWYNLGYKRRGVILSVIQIGQELTIDGIASWGVSRQSISAGPKTLDALGAAATATRNAARKEDASLSKVFCGFAIAILLFAIIQVVSMWIVFEKAGERGWASIVPFYNMWVLADIGGKPGWLGLLMCFCGLIPIPIVGQIVGLVLWIIISIGVARAFDRSVAFGIGLSVVPSIFYPILAFTKD
ncbi:MAG: hypothetical protein JSU70_02225 [Phycisphaerales bacterium]|nr:MAG: hypothetical protein JSU70_02225 [Phycisphaerales bacterium]